MGNMVSTGEKYINLSTSLSLSGLTGKIMLET
jgi:hypothetical protein